MGNINACFELGLCWVRQYCPGMKAGRICEMDMTKDQINPVKFQP